MVQFAIVNVISLSFIGFLVLMVLVGTLSASKAKANSGDYLLASRSVHPIVMALSMLSTNYSGFMFIGFIGYTYNVGISAVWYVLTWAFGDLLAWLTIHKRLRDKSEEQDSNTITSFIGTGEKKSLPGLIKFTSLISFTFLSVYAAAQLKVSSKALHVMLDWDMNMGIVIAGLIVAIYCFSGGIRASIWTDVAQTIFMCAAMFLMSFLTIGKCGGVTELMASLKAVDPNLVSLVPEKTFLHFIIFIISLLVNGYGVIGQPHTMVRAMLIDDSSKMGKARDIYFSLYLIFGIASLSVGLASRILLPDLSSIDPELTLPILAEQYLPDVLVGFILAGIFSAAVSTADSQIISCSASLSQDLFPSLKKSYIFSKISSLIVTVIAICIALFSGQNVFTLTLIAWSSLAASLGPLMVLRCFDFEMDTKTSSVMAFFSILTVIVWRFTLNMPFGIHEVMPATLVAVLIFWIKPFGLLKKQ